MTKCNVFKKLGYGVMLCSALTFSQPCHGSSSEEYNVQSYTVKSTDGISNINMYPRFANDSNLELKDECSTPTLSGFCTANPNASRLSFEGNATIEATNANLTGITIFNDNKLTDQNCQKAGSNFWVNIKDTTTSKIKTDGTNVEVIGLKNNGTQDFVPSICLTGNGTLEVSAKGGNNATAIQLEGTTWATKNEMKKEDGSPLLGTYNPYIIDAKVSAIGWEEGVSGVTVTNNSTGTEFVPINIGNDVSATLNTSNATKIQSALVGVGKVNFFLDKAGTKQATDKDLGVFQQIIGDIVNTNGTVTIASHAEFSRQAYSKGNPLTINSTKISVEKDASANFPSGTDSDAKYNKLSGDTEGDFNFGDYSVNAIIAPTSIKGNYAFGGPSITELETPLFEGSINSKGLIIAKQKPDQKVFIFNANNLQIDAVNDDALNISGITKVLLRTSKNDSLIKSDDQSTAIKGSPSGTLILSGNGGNIESNEAIKDVGTLVVGRYKDAAEQADIPATILNDEASNKWELKGSTNVVENVIVRKGELTSEGNVSIGDRLYIFDGNFNFKPEDSLTVNGGIYQAVNELKLGTGTIVISNAKTITVAAGAKADVQCPNSYANKAKMPAAIVLDGSAKMSVAKSTTPPQTIKAYTMPAGSEYATQAIGILVQGKNNEITFDQAPNFEYFSAATPPVKIDQLDGNQYAIKQAKDASGKLNLGKIASHKTFNGGRIAIDNIQFSPTKTGQLTCQSEVTAKQIIVDLSEATSENASSIQSLKVAKLTDQVNIQAKNTDRLKKGDSVKILTCATNKAEECKAQMLDSDRFTKLEITTDKTTVPTEITHAVKVTNIASNENIFQELHLNPSFAKMVDGWQSTPEQTALKGFLRSSGESYDRIAHWAARSDHLEKARIVSATIDSYNGQIIQHARNHDFTGVHSTTSWLSGFGSWFKQDPIRNIGAKANTYGIMVGTDYQFAQDWLLSLSLGYANSDVDIQGNNKSYNASGEQDHFIGNTTLSFQRYVGLGLLRTTGLFTTVMTKHNYDYKVKTSEGEYKPNAKYNGYAFALVLDADWMLRFKDTNFCYGPSLQLGFDRVVQGSHKAGNAKQGDQGKEPSNYLLNLHADESKTYSVWSILGGKVEYDFNYYNTQGKLFGEIGWKHRFNDNGKDVGHSIVNSDYTGSGEYTKKDMLILNLGVSVIATEQIDFSVSYGLDYGSHTTNNKANIACSYKF